MRAVTVAPAPGETRRPALALANSRRNGAGGTVDDLANPAALQRWLDQHGLAGDPGRIGDAPADRATLGMVRDLRDAVRELLRARVEDRLPAARAVELVNAACAAAPIAAGLVWTDQAGPRQTRESAVAGVAQLVCARLAVDAIELVTGPEHIALRACGAPGCVRLLLSDHPRRQWCSKRCGNRVRASRYYHRHQHAVESAA